MMELSGSELSSGLALERDTVFASCPGNPEMRESASLWFIE